MADAEKQPSSFSHTYIRTKFCFDYNFDCGYHFHLYEFEYAVDDFFFSKLLYNQKKKKDGKMWFFMSTNILCFVIKTRVPQSSHITPQCVTFSAGVSINFI